MIPGQKLAASIFELADRRLTQSAAIAARKIQAPLMGLRIIKTQRQAFDVTCRAIDLQFDQIGAALPNLSDYGSALKSTQVLEPVNGCRRRDK